MALDRGMLRRIDRRVLSELDHGDGVRLVKVPLSKAVWSTWRRYCDAVGVTLGAGVAGLIVHELRAAADDLADTDASVFAERRKEELVLREFQVAARESDLAESEDRLREWTERLGTWERELQTRERRVSVRSKQAATTEATGKKIGRNERCPCCSGRKYKHCHGLTIACEGPESR